MGGDAGRSAPDDGRESFGRSRGPGGEAARRANGDGSRPAGPDRRATIAADHPRIHARAVRHAHPDTAQLTSRHSAPGARSLPTADDLLVSIIVLDRLLAGRFTGAGTRQEAPLLSSSRRALDGPADIGTKQRM